MKYYIEVDGRRTTDYIRGRINGIIYVLTGMPDMSYGYYRIMTKNGYRYVTAIDGDDQLLQKVVDAINEVYPDAILHVTTERPGLEEES